MKLYKQPRWALELKVGDVLISRAGRHRVVRSLSRRKDGRLHSVTFAIKACSWTKRPYTVYCYNDLIFAGYRPAYVSVKLNKKIDREFLKNINADRANQTISCCQARDIP